MTLRLYPEMDGDEGFFSFAVSHEYSLIFILNNERRFNIYEFRKI